MENQLWNLFRETGDVRTYLLYKAGEKQEQEDRKKPKHPPEPPQGIPPASV